MTFKEWMYMEDDKEIFKSIDATFFTNVRIVLKYRGISITAFEKELGFCQGYISKHSKNSVRTYFDDIYRIAEKLCISIDKLADPDFVSWAIINLDK